MPDQGGGWCVKNKIYRKIADRQLLVKSPYSLVNFTHVYHQKQIKKNFELILIKNAADTFKARLLDAILDYFLFGLLLLNSIR